MAHTGVMVAFFPDPISAAKLASLIPNATEMVSDLHLTLGYYGDASRVGDRDVFTETVYDCARMCKPIQAMADGLLRFCALDDLDKQPVCASVSAPALSKVRQMIVQKLSDQGFEPDSRHGFQPHITLSYIPKLSPSPIQVLPEPISVRFDQITIAWAGEQTSFPLGDRIAVSYPWSEDNAIKMGY